MSTGHHHHSGIGSAEVDTALDTAPYARDASRASSASSLHVSREADRAEGRRADPVSGFFSICRLQDEEGSSHNSSCGQSGLRTVGLQLLRVPPNLSLSAKEVFCTELTFVVVAIAPSSLHVNSTGMHAESTGPRLMVPFAPSGPQRLAVFGRVGLELQTETVNPA